jgi:hypothetical protein
MPLELRVVGGMRALSVRFYTTPAADMSLLKNFEFKGLLYDCSECRLCLFISLITIQLLHRHVCLKFHPVPITQAFCDIPLVEFRGILIGLPKLL